MDGLFTPRFCSTENCYNEKQFNETNTGRLSLCIFCLLKEKQKGDK